VGEEIWELPAASSMARRVWPPTAYRNQQKRDGQRPGATAVTSDLAALLEGSNLRGALPGVGPMAVLTGERQLDMATPGGWWWSGFR